MATVVPLDARQSRRAAVVLAHAFHNDPMMCYLLPQPERRRRFLPQFLGSCQRYCLRYGEVVTTTDLAGVACWLPPGQTDLVPARMVRTGLATTVPLLGPGGLRRFFGLIPSMERSHHAQMQEPHWYLWLLGTDPARARRGVGSALLAPTLARADRQEVPVYLETHLEANLGFYGRHGFEPVVDEVANGMRYWGLRREPIGSNSA